LFADDYHFVAIATDKMEGGETLLGELKKDRDGGLPWMVILDGDGNELVTSVGPQGNVGCPVEPHEIEYFVEMIKQSSDASEDELIAISDAMKANAKKIRGN
jgi:hypothetical protein